MTTLNGALNARQAADQLGAHVETVRRLARRGEIPSFKVGKDWRFRPEDLAAWARSHHARHQPYGVLVVDDDEAVLRLIRKILEAGGYRVLCVRSGPEGLAQLRREPVHLVLLDLQMPGMDGPAFLEQLRRAHAELPVIVVTGYPDGDLMFRALAHGPLMVVAKPISPFNLLPAVRTVLHDARQGAAEGQ